MKDELGLEQDSAETTPLTDAFAKRWERVQKLGWSRQDFAKVLEKWLRAGVSLAYREEFTQFLRNKYKFDFTGDERGPQISRVTLHRTRKSKNKRPVGWEIIAPALAMADAVLAEGEIRPGRTMAVIGMANTLARMRNEFTTRYRAFDLASIVCLWEMSKPYWEEAINARQNVEYERERAALRLRRVVETRIGVKLTQTFSELEKMRRAWWVYWILLQETMEEEWIWECLNKTH